MCSYRPKKQLTGKCSVFQKFDRKIDLEFHLYTIQNYYHILIIYHESVIK
jgi:hypothetical protein